jgi:hypothetical protein
MSRLSAKFCSRLRRDAPDVVLVVRIVAHGFEHRDPARDLPDRGEQGSLALLVDEFVEQQLFAQRPADAVVGAAFALPRFDVPAVVVPEVRRQLARAGIEQVGVLEHLVVEIILHRQAQGPGLDAHVDVLGHQDHLAPGIALLQVDHHADDVIVGLADRQVRGNVAVDRLGLQEKAPGDVVRLVAPEWNPFGDRPFGVADDVVEKPARLARVARDLGDAALVVVELLQRHDRQEHVVLLEPEQARRIVHQHVGVENEELGGPGFGAGAAGGHGLARSFGFGSGTDLMLGRFQQNPAPPA